MMVSVRWGTLVALLPVLLAAGCAVAPGGAGTEGGTTGAAAAPPPAESAPGEAKQVPKAIHELVALAENESSAGRNEDAAAHLERALRIAPRSAVLWQNLAVVRYRQNRYSEAESLALKSNTLAGDDKSLKRRNWSLIAACRRLQGDTKGAAEAGRRASELGKGDGG